MGGGVDGSTATHAVWWRGARTLRVRLREGIRGCGLGAGRARACQPVIIGRLPWVSGSRVRLVVGWRWARPRSLAIVSGRGEDLAERGRVLGVTPSMRTRSPALSRGRARTRPAPRRRSGRRWGRRGPPAARVAQRADAGRRVRRRPVDAPPAGVGDVGPRNQGAPTGTVGALSRVPRSGLPQALPEDLAAASLAESRRVRTAPIVSLGPGRRRRCPRSRAGRGSGALGLRARSRRPAAARRAPAPAAGRVAPRSSFRSSSWGFVGPLARRAVRPLAAHSAAKKKRAQRARFFPCRPPGRRRPGG